MTQGQAPGCAATDVLVERLLDDTRRAHALRHLTELPVAARVPVVRAALDESARHMRRDPARTLRLAGALFAAARELASAAPGIDVHALRLGGQSSLLLGRLGAATRLLNRALERAARCGHDLEIALVQVRRMEALAQAGRYDDARAAGADARKHFDVETSAHGRLQVDVALGNLELRLDRHRAGLAHLRRARAIAEHLGNARVMAIVDVNLAVCLEAQHRYRAAARHLDRARDTFEREGLADEVAQVQANRAHLELVRGQLAAALDLYLRAEATFERLEQPRRLARCHAERAELLLQMAMPDAARALAHAERPGLEGEGLQKERAQALVAAALAELLSGSPERADKGLATAAQLFDSEGNDLWRAECELLSSLAAENREDLVRARSLAHSAQEVFLRDGRIARAGSADLALARLDIADGQPARALAKLEAADGRLRRIDAPWLRVEIRRARALATLALGDTCRGAELLVEAVDALEAHRGGLPADEFMVAFLSSREALYTETVTALLDCGREADAFGVAERARSRALVDMMAGRSGPRARRMPGLRSGRLSHERARLNDAYGRLHRAATGVEPLAVEREEALRETVAGAEQRISDILRTERRRDPELLSLSTVDTLSLPAVQSLLDADTTLLEYFTVDDAIVVFVVTRHGFTSRRVPVGSDVLRRLVRRFRFHLSRFNLCERERRVRTDVHLAATRSNLVALAQLLLDPVADLLRTRRLIVAPHGDLHGIPFHALPSRDGWVADRHTVWYVPSATVLGYCAAKRPRADGPTGIVACGDAAAPAIEKEARAVAANAGNDVQLHVGENATLAALRSAARSCRVLHVGAHGMHRADQPMLSSLRLADQWVNAYDVYDLDVRAEMVTLAACESGVSAASRGDEAQGLVRGFLFAGAPRLLVSQWRVHDGTTARFMKTLHATARATGSWEDAVDTAMRDVRATHPHPYHWAPFSLVGYPQGPVEGFRGRRPRRQARRCDSRGGKLA